MRIVWLFELAGEPAEAGYTFTELPQLLLAGDALT